MFFFFFTFSCFTFVGFSGNTAMAEYICVLNKVPTDSYFPLFCMSRIMGFR